MKRLLSLALAVSLLGGCTTVGFAPSKAHATHAPRRSAAQVEVFRTQLPKQRFQEIGAVSVTGTGDPGKLVEKLREKAAENGGDAIIALETFVGGMSATVVRFE